MSLNGELLKVAAAHIVKQAAEPVGWGTALVRNLPGILNGLQGLLPSQQPTEMTDVFQPTATTVNPMQRFGELANMWSAFQNQMGQGAPQPPTTTYFPFLRVTGQ